MSFLCGGWSARDAVECADARPVDAASILCDDDDHWSGRPSDEPFRRAQARPRASSARFDVSKLAPRAEEALPLLQWRDVDVDFGGARAVAGVSGALRCGGFVSVLGPSGAALCGNQPSELSISIKSKSIRLILDESIALVEFSKQSRRVRRNPFNYAHIEVGLKI